MPKHTGLQQALDEAIGHYHSICSIIERSKTRDDDLTAESYISTLTLCFLQEHAKSEMELIGKIMLGLKERENDEQIRPSC